MPRRSCAQANAGERDVEVRASVGAPPKFDTGKPAKPADPRTLIAELRDSKGGEYTSRLSALIKELSGDNQRLARQALVDRMCRMTSRTLKRNLASDDDAEVRLASIQASAVREKKELIPDLIELLVNRDTPTAAAAHDALVRLSGQDFGPKAENATVVASFVAQKTWRQWWESGGKNR